MKRPPADEADDLFFVWKKNREIQDLEKMLKRRASDASDDVFL